MLTPHALVAASLGALAVYTLCLVALHLLPTGFDPRRDPVSLYAAGRWGWVYALAQMAAACCALGLAAALVELRAPLPWLGWAGLVALVALGLARLALPFVPARMADRERQPGEPLPRRVIIHQSLALVSFTCIALTTILLTGPLIAWGGWRGPAGGLVGAAVYTPLAVLFFPISGALPRLRPYFGLAQRAIYGGIIAWQALALIPLAR